MQTRHLHQLLSRLERVADVGCAEISFNEMMFRFDADRFTVTIWREIADKWEELLANTRTMSDKKDVPLLVGESQPGYVFVWGEGMTTSKDSWLKDVRELAPRTGANEVMTA